jgi:hypothetical protein
LSWLSNKRGERWLTRYVITHPTPKGDEPESKYKQIDVLVDVYGRVAKIGPKNIVCRKYVFGKWRYQSVTIFAPMSNETLNGNQGVTLMTITFDLISASVWGSNFKM